MFRKALQKPRLNYSTCASILHADRRFFIVPLFLLFAQLTDCSEPGRDNDRFIYLRAKWTLLIRIIIDGGKISLCMIFHVKIPREPLSIEFFFHIDFFHLLLSFISLCDQSFTRREFLFIVKITVGFRN